MNVWHITLSAEVPQGGFWLPAAGSVLLTTIQATGMEFVSVDSFHVLDLARITVSVRTDDPAPLIKAAETVARVEGAKLEVREAD